MITDKNFFQENCIIEFGLHDLYNECKSKMTKIEKAKFNNDQKKLD